MACKGGLDRRRCGVAISNFANEDHVGILPENGAKTGRKGHARSGVDVALDDSVKLDFNRIFDRDDISINRIQVVECGVERCCFAGFPLVL